MTDYSLKSGYFNTTHYLDCGPAGGPLMIFLHGWPAIGLMWRAQMRAFSEKGWRCIAPDLRGYGRSGTPECAEAYTIEKSVTDMAELHDHLGGAPAVWVGHDWGSVVAGQLAAHQAWRCRCVALISLAYLPEANALRSLIPLVDRRIYPAEQYPDGQWDYYRFYNTHFGPAVADLNADIHATLSSVYRAGSPRVAGEVSPNALVTRNGGRFGSAHRAPALKPDTALWPLEDFDELVRSFNLTGFRPACAWYINDSANIAYARQAPDEGGLSMPVLFMNGEWDQICNISGNRLGDPMRKACKDLTIVNLPAGHWLPLECKAEVVQILSDWLITRKVNAS